MFDIEVIGDGLPADEVRRLCRATLGHLGIDHGHLAVEFVDGKRIAELNARFRDKPTPTDVLSFPIDGWDEDVGSQTSHAQGFGPQRELGDVVICPEYTIDLAEAVVHGVLHLAGMDHERDDGEMLALQAQILAQRST